MRVTHQTIATSTLANLQASLSRVSSLQAQMSSGRVINRASDSPSGTVDALSLRSQLRQSAQHARAGDDAVGWLATEDTSLQAGLGLLRKAKELGVAGASTGSAGPQGREALATEVESLRAALLATANAKYGSRPVFGGTTGGGVAFDATGTYVGSPVSGSPSDPAAANAVARVVGPGVTVRVDEPGTAAFGDGATSVFAVLDRLAADLRSGTAATSGVLDEVDAALGTMTGRLADVGARYARVESAKASAEDAKVSLKGSLAQVENIDLPKTIVELQMQQVAYQAALGATAKVIQPTLLDFLR